jgi:hypothetical protein
MAFSKEELLSSMFDLLSSQFIKKLLKSFILGNKSNTLSIIFKTRPYCRQNLQKIL